MHIIKLILRNGFILLIPILVWNLIFTSNLPLAYEQKSFDSNIPIFLLIGENIFRIIVFIFPILLKINISASNGKLGLLIYGFGSMLYYISWLMLIYAPNSFWSTSEIGFTAPAYPPLIWLIGIGLMADSYYFKLSYIKWHFIIPSILFALFHITHTYLVFLRTKNL